MTDLEHYVENAICFLEDGGEYEDFFEDNLLKQGEEQTGLSLKAMWEIAQYITCTYKPWLENIEDYRKVPDSAVVLTKEEYERVTSSRKIRVVTKHEEDDYEICIPANEYDEMFEQARKETAKEILDYFDRYAGTGKKLIGDMINEQRKKYGLEMEE